MKWKSIILLLVLFSSTQCQTLIQIKNIFGFEAYYDLKNLFPRKCFNILFNDENSTSKILNGTLYEAIYTFSYSKIALFDMVQTGWSVEMRELDINTIKNQSDQVKVYNTLNLWDYDKTKPIFYISLKNGFFNLEFLFQVYEGNILDLIDFRGNRTTIVSRSYYNSNN
jgi:hypothetical protein